MKITKLSFVFIFSCLLLFIQGACIEINEVIQMKEDGTTLLNLSIFVPDVPDDKASSKTSAKGKKPEDIAKSLAGANISGIKFLGEQEKKINGLNQVSLNFELASLQDISKLYQTIDEAEKASDEKKGANPQASFDHIFSKSPYTVKKDSSGNIIITREFKPDPKNLKPKPKVKKKEGDLDFGDEMGDVFLNMIYITYEFFSPTDIISSNAQQQFGRNLRWKTSLGYLMKNPLKMEIKIKSSPELEKILK